MKGFRIILPLTLLLACFCFSLQAQQSSKSKSREVIYEKPGEVAQVQIRNVTSINGPNTDFGPAYYQNGLVFVSSKKKFGARDKKTKEPYFELYFAPFDPNGNPANEQQFSVNINSTKHEGPVTFTRDWQTMYFTRNNMAKGIQKADHKGVVHLKIYEAKRSAFDWSNVQELPFNSDNYSCMHPTLSADGNTMVFSSDKEGGFGGFDLYKTTRTRTGWSEPVNMGNKINTERNEVFPFQHSGGDLFFSTSGHNSYGGLDIFVAKYKVSSGWKISNLGKPFNSTSDDLGIILNDEANSGFFASSREKGYGKDDIYSFKIQNGLQTIAPLTPQRIKLKVTDMRGKPVQGAAIRVLTASEEGYLSGQGDFYRMDLQPLEDQSNTVNFKLVRKDADNLGAADNYTNAAGEAYQEFKPYEHYIVIANIPGQRSTEKMFKLTASNPSTLMLILPETKQCQKVKGIVVHEQFGKRIENCLVRFTNKSTSEQTTISSDKNGEFSVCLPGDGLYLYRVERDGFDSENKTVEIGNSRKNFVEVRMRPNSITGSKFATSGPIQEGSVIVINDIYYDFNQSTLNESGVKYMEGLLQMLINYPSMEIDLVSHTDAQGTDTHNQTLAEKRAEHAKAYLAYRGIKKDRIRAIGKGESEILNRCKNGVQCSNEEHQKNIRTEIIVRKLANGVQINPKN